jgi:hypothetical protein
MEHIRRQPGPSTGVLKPLYPYYSPQSGVEEPRPLREVRKRKKEEGSVRGMLKKLVDEKESGQKRKETKVLKKPWKIPRKWVSKAKRAEKKRDAVLVFYLNIKGELEQPMIVPIYGGNMVIIKNKVYEVDPRAFWNMKVGFNRIYKLLIIKEIDRRPVSNLDWDDIRIRGDATDSDEFLIKAALRAQITTAAKKLGRGAIIIIIIAIAALLVFFFMQ